MNNIIEETTPESTIPAQIAEQTAGEQSKRGRSATRKNKVVNPDNIAEAPLVDDAVALDEAAAAKAKADADAAETKAAAKAQREAAAAAKKAEKEAAAAAKGPGKIEQILKLHMEGKSNKEIVEAGFNKTTVSIQVAKFKKEHGTVETPAPAASADAMPTGEVLSTEGAQL